MDWWRWKSKTQRKHNYHKETKFQLKSLLTFSELNWKCDLEKKCKIAKMTKKWEGKKLITLFNKKKNKASVQFSNHLNVRVFNNNYQSFRGRTNSWGLSNGPINLLPSVDNTIRSIVWLILILYLISKAVLITVMSEKCWTGNIESIKER